MNTYVDGLSEEEWLSRQERIKRRWLLAWALLATAAVLVQAWILWIENWPLHV